jgi:hypothetical protein
MNKMIYVEWEKIYLSIRLQKLRGNYVYLSSTCRDLDIKLNRIDCNVCFEDEGGNLIEASHIKQGWKRKLNCWKLVSDQRNFYCFINDTNCKRPKKDNKKEIGRRNESINQKKRGITWKKALKRIQCEREKSLDLLKFNYFSVSYRLSIFNSM